jgi:hypothetical protein
LLIEPEHDSRVLHAEYLHAFGFTAVTTDTMGHGLRRASDADVIVTWILVSASSGRMRFRSTWMNTKKNLAVPTSCSAGTNPAVVAAPTTFGGPLRAAPTTSPQLDSYRQGRWWME